MGFNQIETFKHYFSGMILKFKDNRTSPNLIRIGLVLAVLLGGLVGYYWQDMPFFPAPKFNIVGQAYITDGDTIRVQGKKIRLHGIDAPERDQTCSIKGRKWNCGAVSTAYLTRLINYQKVKCTKLSTGRYGRTIATCINNKGQDINSAMVSSGHAVAYTYYTYIYFPEQIEAWWSKRGIWQGEFVEPYQYRKSGRAP
ncbi:thermonuclease family protein [Paremcibacter congregatus]|uniref:thermonuclease family protein n=1 Tax=Paremcibacter congregatus TaxID=2043170 RepID=UPI0013FDC040|nr:thermonuclease family protein [Paremcibacter congregatus]